MTSAPKLRREQYTVGWISALPKEQTACRLDEYHLNLPGKKHDPTYILGRIASHNVVLACLPVTGTNAAAQCAAKLQERFPNLRFLLMVGIGGGVPVQHDIRLGDVVVGMPTKQYPGVCQYDFGTKNQGQPLQVLPSYFGRPPAVLITAVAALQAKYLHMDSKNALGQALTNYVDYLVKSFPEMQGSRKPQLDELYEPAYEHLDSNLSCEMCQCDENRQVRRTPRGRDIHPHLHQGLIASGNAVMRDAFERDRLGQEIGVICFEMEGGGLITDSPLGCLVIRGICDYCDSHKNKGWQEYSAAVAAAYARELLHVISPIEITEENQRADEVHNELDDNAGELLEWLSALPYAEAQSNLLEARQRGTGRWFLESTQFQDWLQSRGQILLCPGEAGAGKTFISCSVIDYVQERVSRDPSMCICYFYFYYAQRNIQTLQNVFACLLRQMVAVALPKIPSVAKELYGGNKRQGTNPSMEKYLEALIEAGKEFSQVIFVFDALDEIPHDQGLRGDFIRILIRLQDALKANILITARPLSDIQARFPEAIRLPIKAHEVDLQLYLQSRVNTLAACVRKNKDLQDQICNTLVRAVDGIFLLARLHIDSLRFALTPFDINQALAQSPKVVLSQAYEDALKRIDDQPPHFRDIAKQIINWIPTPNDQFDITVRELQHALMLRQHPRFSEENAIEPEDLISMCAGLITLDEQAQVVRFAHRTTEEFFLGGALKNWAPGADADVVAICVLCLKSVPTYSEIGATDLAGYLDAIKQDYPLYKFAAEGWGSFAFYASQSGPSQPWQKLAKELCMDQERMATALKVEGPRMYHANPLGEATTSAHFAAFHGLTGLMADLINEKFPVDTANNFGRTPLSWAAEAGRGWVARLLVQDQIVDVNFKDYAHGLAPLYYAVWKDRKHIVELLMTRKDLDINIRDKQGKTPLHYAVGSNVEILKQLLSHRSIRVNCRDKSRRETPLFKAIRWQRSDAVQLLLQRKDVSTTIRDSRGRTPLAVACKNASSEIVNQLLNRDDVGILARDDAGRTPLTYALDNENQDIAQLMVARLNLKGWPLAQ